MFFKYFSFFIFFICISNSAQTKILFDATKAESAGNADWVIDSDNFNLGFFNGPAVLGGSEANPQRIPTPAQSGITTTTSESYWDGALSSWAIDCVRQGYVVETLPYNGLITYGVSSNTQDLSHYKVFVIDEPNILFTNAEKNAIISFVSNGGSLLMISDHDVSDRNNDTYDSPNIWNDLLQNNAVQVNPFGIIFDLANFSQTTSNIANVPSNTILHGSYGNVTQVKWSSGTSMTLSTTANSSVKGLIYKTGSINSGTTNVMCASATYNLGKVIAIGDSSIPDDGSGDLGDILYDGYIQDASGNHRKLLMNAMIWLAESTLSTTNLESTEKSIAIVQNPVKDKILQLYFDNQNLTNTSFIIYDSLGRMVKQFSIENQKETSIQNFDCNNLKTGVYFGKISNGIYIKMIPFIIPN